LIIMGSQLQVTAQKCDGTYSTAIVWFLDSKGMRIITNKIQSG
jgi:hypothetical protein